MKSVEQELNEIEVDWEVNYLELVATKDFRYIVEVKREEVILKLLIPESYPDSTLTLKFGEKEMKGINAEMQQSILRVAQQKLSENIGKPMVRVILEDIWNQIKSATAKSDPEIREKNTHTEQSQRRKKKKKIKYKIACSFGVVGGNQPFHDFPDAKPPSVGKKVVSDSIQCNKAAVAVNKAKDELSRTKPEGKAPPMKTARDVINRLKWDEQLKDEHFKVGYEDRFKGVLEVPVFDLNWHDEISSTGPADKLAIPEHRVQYFKFNSKIVWEKATKTDLIFGSTGSKIDILKLIKSIKELKEEEDMPVAQSHNGTSSDEMRMNPPVEAVELKESSNFPGARAPMHKENPDDADEVTKKPEQSSEEMLAKPEDVITELINPCEETEGHIEEDVRQILNNILTKFDSLDISQKGNAVPLREAGGGWRPGKGYHGSNSDRGQDRGHNVHGRHYVYSHRQRGKRERGRDGGAQRFEREDFAWSQSQYPHSHCIAFGLDEDSSKKLSHMIESDLSKLSYDRIDIPLPIMSTFYLQSQNDVEELVQAVKWACKSWRSFQTETGEITVRSGRVTMPLFNRSLKKLHGKILRNIRKDTYHYDFHNWPHVLLGTVRDVSDHAQIKNEWRNITITSLYLHKLPGSSFDDQMVPAEKFQLQAQQKNYETGRKRDYSHDRDHQYTPKQRRYYDKDGEWEITISKRLSAILRHGSMGFKVDEEGFIEVNKLLAHQFFRSHGVNERDIESIVEANAKKRFTLQGTQGNFRIRANQGHTVQVDNLSLKEITDPLEFPKVVHGTSLKYWDSILERGLSRMRRNHIHMTTAEPRSSREVISGMRNSSNCFIYIDLMKAVKDGIKFYTSDNGVILTEGINGVLGRKYFADAAGVQRGERFRLPIPHEGEEEASNSASHQDEARAEVPKSSKD